jgi:hypothetical protein
MESMPDRRAVQSAAELTVGKNLLSINNNNLTLIKNHTVKMCGAWDSAVGKATRYGLDGPGIESQYGRDLPPRPALGLTQPSIQ